MVATAIRTVFAQPKPSTCTPSSTSSPGMLGRQFPAVEALLQGAADGLLAFTAFPASQWKNIWSINPLERLNKETKGVRR
jgi:putative transposase